MSATIKAAYNFVPLAKKVFYPKWANQVSHDIPFSNQVSGEITLEITAQTDIFVRNSSLNHNSNNEFCHIGKGGDKRYFIPGSSIKGVIRSVLEIMSFGRISLLNNEVSRLVNRSRVNYGKPLDSVKKYMDNYDDACPDLADLIFGYTNIGDKSLKGRVHVSHAFASPDTIKVSEKVIYTLASPKSSFLPNYVVDRKMYSDLGSEISGWKRYLLKPICDGKAIDKYNEKYDSILNPLKAGTTFNCKIHYHNLKPLELQSLISAITFHYKDNCYHQIGQGKGYGYGRVKIDIIDFNKEQNPLTDYENIMDSFIGEGKGGWKESKQLKELFLMSSTINKAKNFQYMTLKEHGKVWNDLDCILGRFSSLEQGVFEQNSNKNIKQMQRSNDVSTDIGVEVTGVLVPEFSSKDKNWIKKKAILNCAVSQLGDYFDVINGDLKARYEIESSEISLDKIYGQQITIEVLKPNDRSRIRVKINSVLK